MRRRPVSPRVRLRPEPVWEEITRRNVSQNELARLVDISSGYLFQLLNGRKSPSPEVRRRLQAALDISHFDELFTVEHDEA